MNYFNVFFIAFLSFTGSSLTSYSRYHYGKILLSLYLSKVCSISTLLKDLFFLLWDPILLLVNARIPYCSAIVYLFFHVYNFSFSKFPYFSDI